MVAFMLTIYISVFAILSRRAQCTHVSTQHVSTACQTYVSQATCPPSLQRPICRTESHLRHANSLQQIMPRFCAEKMKKQKANAKVACRTG